ncbi:sugar-phosphatase [Georgenia satyanarayanai]|uniref:Sugar-phosphatase n=1 Tax=Georgenia satyanarayanai TaxID=860221 RepID=A0A2Y9A7U2_9MICO|nr:HAD family phosphatase [Georgenia satyanarayanai]PYG00234.1 sugar-phosphatase [Georgenia satyanarayanai]SSA40544.1 sugar-phosphatase [Georgenia satyanarayanai]
MGVTSTHDLRVRAGEFLSRPGAAVLLDLDGTLVDSEPMQRAAFAAYFASRGWDVPETVVRQFMGRRGRESFAAIQGPWAGEDPVALTDAVIALTDPLTHPPVAVPGAAEAIRAWRERGLPVSLVTSAFRTWAEEALELLGVVGLGVRLVTAEDTPVGKPAPAPFLLGAERLGVDPADCLAAEDSVAGLASARAAGVGLAIGVTTSLDADTLTGAGADAVVPDLTALAP